MTVSRLNEAGISLPSASRPSTPRLLSKWPYVVRAGDVRVKIYRSNATVRGQPYRTFTLSYFSGGRRQRRQFADFAKAHLEAAKIASEKAQGALGAAALSGEERVALQAALTKLAELKGTASSTPGMLIEIVRDYLEARKLVPSATSLTQVAEFYARRNPVGLAQKRVEEVVDEFIADRRNAGCSAIHLRDLDIRLKRQFAAAFVLPINSIHAPQIQQWVYDLQNVKTRKPAKGRTKENMLRSVSSLFSFARRMKYVSPELAVEVADIPTPKKDATAIEIYTPAEMAAILSTADEQVIPPLAIAAFAGLRLAEVSRLDWRDVRLGDQQIVVEANKAKTAARRIVPICDNLAVWLANHVRPFGPINPCQEAESAVGNALGDRFERAAARAKVGWKRNGFRHSYISYRVAVIKNVPEVALECGNSPQVIFSNYRALATEAVGKAWFEIKPSRQAQEAGPSRILAFGSR